MENIQIKVIDREKKEHVLSSPFDIGLNLMELCKAYDLPVEGICGGIALCGSCHCYVLSEHEVEQLSEDEEAQLDQVLHVNNYSRLACQIKVTEKVNDMVVQLANVE